MVGGGAATYFPPLVTPTQPGNSTHCQLCKLCKLCKVQIVQCANCQLCKPKKGIWRQHLQIVCRKYFSFYILYLQQERTGENTERSPTSLKQMNFRNSFKSESTQRAIREHQRASRENSESIREHPESPHLTCGA